MTSHHRRRSALWLGLLATAAVFTLGGPGGAGQAADPPAQAFPTGFRPIDPYLQVDAMRRGINILGYDPAWKGGAPRFQASHFTIIRQGGFDTIRVNLEAFSHMDADNRLDPAWLKRLDWIVDTANKAGLTVILDEHNFNECGKDPAACRPRLLAFWKQVGERYRDTPNTVVFELLNEPNSGLTANLWNGLMHDALAVVRTTNPTRNVIVGPAHWNSLDDLQYLYLPADDHHLIVTFHYYTPMEFTHQGASWNEATAHMSGVQWGSTADLTRMDADFNRVQLWARQHHRPILLGEFGAYDKGEMVYRARYTAAAARGAEARGWAWAYWQFDSDFVAYDIDKGQWIEPIHKALVP